MSMFDYVYYETDCPICGHICNEFQTKDLDRLLEWVDISKVSEFHDICTNCGTYISFRRGINNKLSIAVPEKHIINKIKKIKSKKDVLLNIKSNNEIIRKFCELKLKEGNLD